MNKRFVILFPLILFIEGTLLQEQDFSFNLVPLRKKSLNFESFLFLFYFSQMLHYNFVLFFDRQTSENSETQVFIVLATYLGLISLVHFSLSSNFVLSLDGSLHFFSKPKCCNTLPFHQL